MRMELNLFRAIGGLLVCVVGLATTVGIALIATASVHDVLASDTLALGALIFVGARGLVFTVRTASRCWGSGVGPPW